MFKIGLYKNIKTNVFTEVGIDFDNNKFLFGISTEIEFKDGTEIRTKKTIKVDEIISFYIRIWIFKTVFSCSINLDKTKRNIWFWKMKKKRNNFKIVFGRSGYKSNISEMKKLKNEKRK